MDEYYTHYPGGNHKQRWEFEYIPVCSMFKAESKVNQEKGGWICKRMEGIGKKEDCVGSWQSD